MEPIKKSYTREQLQNAAKTWMKNNKDGYTKESYYTTLGALVDFVTDLFDEINTAEVAGTCNHCGGNVFYGATAGEYEHQCKDEMLGQPNNTGRDSQPARLTKGQTT